MIGIPNNFEDTKKGRCGADVNISCPGTIPSRKTCQKCNLYDPSMEIPREEYPKSLKEAREGF